MNTMMVLDGGFKGVIFALTAFIACDAAQTIVGSALDALFGPIWAAL